MAGPRIVVEITGDTKGLERSFGRFDHTLGKAARGAALAAGAAGFGAIFATLRTGFGEVKESQEVMAQTDAVLKSTGGAAKVSAKQVEDLAGSLSRLTGTDDEAIQAGENLLLTFKNIKNEAGKGSRVFDRATKAALDLSRAGFGSLDTTAKQLGKALNDPVRGMTALGRAGVTFSEAQKKTIAALVKTGDTLGAQKLILREVESQVGGSAEAYGKTLPGQLAKAKNAFGEMAGSLTTMLVPAMESLAKVGASVSTFMSEHTTLAKIAMGALAAFSSVLLVAAASSKAWLAIQLVVKAATVAWTAAQWALNVAMTANPIGAVIVAVAALAAGIVVAWKKSETFRAVVTAAWEAVKGAVVGFVQYFKGTAWPAIQGVFNLAVGAVRIYIGIWRTLIETVITVVRTLIDVAGKGFKKLQEIVTPPLEAIEMVVRAVGDAVNWLLGKIKAVIDKAADLLSVVGKVSGAVGAVSGFVGKIPGFAAGGRVTAGQPVIVGERGPELFVPGSSGHIIPNGAASSRAGGGTIINIAFPNYVGSRSELVEEVRRGLADVARRNPGALPGVA